MRLVLIGLLFAAAAAAVYGCSAASEDAPRPEPGPPPQQFTPAAMDFDRPCTLLTPADASALMNQPYFTTIATDSVEDNRVRCAQAVGEGGLHGVMELQVEYPVDGRTAEIAFLDICRAHPGGASPGLSAAVPVPGAARPVSAAPRDVVGRACRLAEGGYALLLPDRVLKMQVRDGTGTPVPEAAHALARLVSQRAAAHRA